MYLFMFGIVGTIQSTVSARAVCTILLTHFVLFCMIWFSVNDLMLIVVIVYLS